MGCSTVKELNLDPNSNYESEERKMTKPDNKMQAYAL